MKVSRILSTKRREIITIQPDQLIREATRLAGRSQHWRAGRG
jgi:hypothetical protein